MADNVKDVFWKAGLWYDQNQGQIGYEKIPQEQYWTTVTKAGIEIIRPTQREHDEFVKNAKPNWRAWKKQVGEKIGQQAIDLALGKV